MRIACYPVIATIGLLSTTAFGAALTPGDILVYQVGDGSSTTITSGTAAAVFLDEYTTSGVLVQQIAVPTASVAGGNQALTDSPSASTDGLLTLSANGQYVTFGGYNATVGTTGVVSSTVNRTIGVVDASGVVNTSTAASIDSGNNIRSVVTTNGTQFYTAGAGGGVYSLTGGSSNATATQLNSSSSRQVTVFNNQLYVDTSSTIYSLGSGLPTTGTPTATPLPGVATNGSPTGFLFESLNAASHGAADTLYVADSTNGIIKYSLVSGTWTKTGSVAGSFNDLSAELINGTVDLFAISSNNKLVALTDSSGYDGTLSSSVTTLVTANSHEVFDGVALAPVPLPAALPLLLSGLGGFGFMRRRRRV